MEGLMSFKKFSADWPLDPSVQACLKGQILQNISLPLDFRRKQIMSPISINLELFSFLHISLFHILKLMQWDCLQQFNWKLKSALAVYLLLAFDYGTMLFLDLV